MHSLGFWKRMIRPHTLSASYVPVIIGTTYAMQVSGKLNLLFFLLALFSSVLIQISVNLFNEYFDFKHGLDHKESVGIGGTIVRDGATPQFVLSCAIFALCLSGGMGLYLSYKTSWLLLLFGVISVLCGYLYCSGPIPISRTPFGELFAGGLMGTGIIGVSYYVQQLRIDITTIYLSIPTLILIALILTANNLRDRVNDQINGRKTLAIILGHHRTLVFMILSLIFTYAWLIVLFFLNFSYLIFLPFITIPLSLSVIRQFKKEDQSPLQMMPAMAGMSTLNKQFGLWLALALLLKNFII